MKNPVISLGLSTPGIFLLRHFPKFGIKAYGLDSNPSELGFRSRFGIKSICPDPEIDGKGFFDYMMKMRKDFDVKPVLIPSSDKFVLPLNDYADELSESFYFTVPEGGLLRKLTSKRYTYELAVKFGFPAPKTCFVSDVEDLHIFIKDAEFPCILKPEFPESWRSGFLEEYCGGEKVIIVNSADEILEKYDVIRKYDDRVIVQEIIQGEDSNLHYFVSYMDRNQNCIGSFTGIKERIAPVHFGSASYVNLVYNKELEEMSVKWLKNLKFRGASGIEVKKDLRDNQYKLIEVNPRFGLWDEVGTKFGIDIAMMSYKELLGETLEPVVNRNINIRWISIHRDIRSSAEYVSKGILPPSGILLSYFDFPIYVGDMRWNDIGLSFHLIKNLFKGIFRRLFKKNKN
ncbi:MAG: ATP-grasp domain-containing protein [Ignavibacteria bacterium]|nr:ATP-grasp domain-containing protein [Ignavibacteria bacterium]